MKKLLENTYKLPWKELDNPNGWIEPTTYCNICCPGCYRGADKSSHKPVHFKLVELKKQIDWFIEKRNIHTLSIAGGEPLLYPSILELVKYASDKKLRVMIYSNGLCLNKELLIQLRDAGATQIVIHVDRFQERQDFNKIKDVGFLQQKFCDLFKEIGGIALGFIQPLSESYEKDMTSVLNVSQKNISVVSLIVFTLYKDICWDENIRKKISTKINMKEVSNSIMNLDGFVPASYLPSQQNAEEASWIFGTRVGTENKIFGYFNSSFYKHIHENYRRKKGRYLFISRINSVKFWRLFRFFSYADIRKILSKYMSFKINNMHNKTSALYFQTILLLRGPEKIANKWDLCESCPDRMIHNGRLVPSCILEDIKNNDNIEYQKVDF